MANENYDPHDQAYWGKGKESHLGHFGVRVGQVRRHLRGSILPSVDLVQDVGQREAPLAPPARSGCYATQHGLLDGADGALGKVGVANGHLLLNVPEIHQILNSLLNSEPSLEHTLAGTPRVWNTFFLQPAAVVKTVLQRLGAHFFGQRIDGHLLPKAFMSARSTCSWFMLCGRSFVQKRLHFLSGDAGVAGLSLLQRLRYAAEAGARILVDGLDGSSAGVSHVSYGFFNPQASTSSSRAWKPLHTQSQLVRRE